MIKRFIKRNLFLVGVMFFAALGIAVLLVLSGIQYIEMLKCSDETEELNKKKLRLEKQQPAAIRENIERLQSDIDGYTVAYESMKQYFGQTLQPALEGFVARLNDIYWFRVFKDFALVSGEFKKLYEQSRNDSAAAAKIPGYLRLYLRDKFADDKDAAEQRVKDLNNALKVAKAAEKDAILKDLTKVRELRDAFVRLSRYNEDNLHILTVKTLQEKFKIFWESEKALQGPREQTYRRFRATSGVLSVAGGSKLWSLDAWDEAIEEFEAIAGKTTMEKIDERNREEVFLASLGLERNMGQSQPRLAAFARDMQSEVVKLLTEDNDISMMGVYFTAGTVPVLKTNKDFNDISEVRNGDQNQTARTSGSGQTENSNVNPADVIRHWEIVGDIARRLVATKINSLEELSYINLQGRDENGCKYYTYSLSVVGRINEVRDLLNSFSGAYKDNRMYVIKRISLKKQEDQVQDIIDVAQGILGDKGEEAAKLAVKNENEGAAPAEDGETKVKIMAPATYFKEKEVDGECVAGRSSLCIANIVLEYVVYSGNILK